MSEVLSQDEIDQLLSAIAAGSSDDESENITKSRRVKIYDFMRPDVFSREQLRTISNVSELFARLYTKTLSTQLKTTCHVHVASVDQLTFEEFIRSIPTPTEVNVEVVNVDGQDYPLVTEFDPAVAFTMLDIMPSIESDKKKKNIGNRDLTDDEITKWEKTFVGPFLSLLKKAFRTGFDSNIRSISNKKTENNPQFVDVLNPTDMVALVSLEVKVGNNEGMMNLCLPAQLAQKLCDDYNGVVRPDAKPFDLPRFENTIKIPLNVSLGKTSKTIKEIRGLGEGSIIELDKFAGEPVDLEIDGQVFAKGEVVVIDENFGIRIVELV